MSTHANTLRLNVTGKHEAGSLPSDFANPYGQAGFGTETSSQFGLVPFTQFGAAILATAADQAHGGAMSGSDIEAGSSFAEVTTSGSGLVFNNTYTANCTASYIACIVAAEKQLQSLFTNTDTINVTFNEANGGNSGVALGNSFYYQNYSYAAVRAALLKVAPGDVLPTTDPSGGASWAIPVAYARMLGLTTYTEPTDDTVTLNTYYNWSFGQDVINGLTHELSEGGLGRIGGLGGSGGGGWSTMDLFRYNAAGQADYSNGRDGQTTYFSSNGGASLSNANLPGKGAPTLSFNNQYNSSGTKVNGGDTADWVQNNVFGSTGGGETLALTQTELDVMQALGWHLSLSQDVDSQSGNWETPANWSTGSMPIEPQDVDIKAAVVTLDANVIVNSIATSSGGILEIGDSAPTRLTAVDGTTLNTRDTSFVATGNAGEILVYTGSTLQLGYFDEGFDNAGTLTVGKGAGGSGAGYLDIAGEIDLSGGGTLNLGQTGTAGDILNAPSTTGDSLINIDNAIIGGGLIELGGTFDNQASGLVEATSSLQISAAATFTNEGLITAEAGATLDFGLDGATESLGNAGSVFIDAGADLRISGNFTASGSGGIYFKGAGAEITSDGASATFVNAGTIEAEYSGQIGDANLTFTNAGSVAVSSAGTTLTIATGANTVVNTGTLVAANSATLVIASNLNNQNVLTAGAVSSSQTTTGVVDLGLDGGTMSAANSGAIDVYGGSDLAISGNYTVSGSGEISLKGAGAAITSDGLAPATFTNASNIDAFASGQIGDVGIKSANDLTFVNIGSVVALGTGVTLTINTGANAINDNGGVLVAETGATLAIDSNIDTGTGGTIEATSGGTVLIAGALSGGGTLSAGSGALIELTGGGSFGGAITGAGEVLIAGATTLTVGASLSVGNLVETANLTLASVSLTNTATDSFSIAASGGSTVTIGGTGTGSQFSNAGTLLADGAGTAAINVALVDTGIVSATSGTLRINDGLSGTGTVSAGAGATVAISHGASFAGALTGAGTFNLSGAAVTLSTGASLSAGKVAETANLILSSDAITNAAGDSFIITAGAGRTVGIDSSGTGNQFTNAGNFGANGAGTAVINTSFVDTGKVLVGAGTLTVGGAVSGNGTLDPGSGAVLNLDGGGSFAGALAGAGTLNIASKAVTLTTGATLAVSHVTQAANLTLASVAITNAAADAFSLTASSGATIKLGSTGAGSSFTNAGSLTANGAGTADVSTAFVNSGVVSTTSGTLAFIGSVTNTGTILAGAGLTTLSKTVGGTGTLAMGASGTLSLGLGTGSGQTVAFLAGTGLLDLSVPLDFAGLISGFGGGDQIDLINTPETSFTYAGNLLTVQNGGTTVAKLNFAGASNSFSLASDHHGGTLITFG